jgi:predicted nuclease with RNAse H fold
MTPTLIAGADYSGAKTVPNETWLAIGTLTNVGLEISQLSRCGSHKLAIELNAVKQLKAVGLDFPFSLPADFIKFLAEKLEQPVFETWQQLVEKLAFLPFEKFLELVTEFKVEPKRLADKALNRVAISPLHRGNPSMVQMTYQGMKLLASLDPKIFFVLPFQDAVPFGCAVMETYPREVLCSLNLPDTGYKTKDSEQSATLRKEIVRRLTRIRESKLVGRENCPNLTLSKGVERAAQESDHALDAVLACYSTAMWHTAPKLFKDPFETDDMNVFLEGWIYTPSLLKAQA